MTKVERTKNSSWNFNTDPGAQLRDLPDSGITPYFDEMNFIQGVAWPAKPNLT